MQLTRFTDLGLRILMRLAVQDEETDPATTRAVADQFAVKYTHAAKVVTALQKLGVVETRRGRAGGLRLREDSSTLSLGRLVRVLEGDREVVECEGSDPCPLRGGCRLRSTLRDAQKATLPVIGAAIGDITPVFYQRMFAAHPELERDLFNRGNQAQGDQQSALAGAIAGYATLLVAEDGRDPDEVLARIAHKHASLGIVEDQYPIVHEHLFAAIVEVLGDAVTPEVASAWDEVYRHMARALVAIEKGLYAGTGVADGDVWRTLVLRRRLQESPETVSFVLGAADGRPLPQARPGRYVSVQVTLADGARQLRQYSLTHAPELSQWGISVKAVPASRTDDGTIVPAGEVSNFLHQSLFEGDEIRVSAPFGELVLQDSDSPLVLASAGIGITPIIGILHYLVATGSTREVLVLHADRSPARHAHRQELKDLVEALPAASLHRWYEDLGVRPTRDVLRAGRVDLGTVEIPTGAQIYLCGPLPFMESVRGALVEQHVPGADIHYEVFGPDKWLASA